MPPSSRDDQAPRVADGRRVDVLVRVLHLRHRRAVDAALVGEGGPADVRLVVVGAEVGDLGDGAREIGERGQVAAAGGVSTRSVLSARLARMRDQVRVAAALAVAVDRALDVADAGLDRGEGVGHREVRVVVGVDAPGDAGRARVGLERASTSPRIAVISSVRVPPLVSHRTSSPAPAWSAARSVASA